MILELWGSNGPFFGSRHATGCIRSRSQSGRACRLKAPVPASLGRACGVSFRGLSLKFFEAHAAIVHSNVNGRLRRASERPTERQLDAKLRNRCSRGSDQAAKLSRKQCGACSPPKRGRGRHDRLFPLVGRRAESLEAHPETEVDAAGLVGYSQNPEASAGNITRANRLG